MRNSLLSPLASLPVDAISNDILEKLQVNYKAEETLINDDTSMSTHDKIHARRESLYFYLGSVLLVSLACVYIKTPTYC